MTRRSIEADFWARVDRSGDCWAWTGALNAKGYGICRYQGRTLLAHRLAFGFTSGPVPSGDLDHLCRNRRCVNPGHLEAVLHRDNVLRGESPVAVSVRTNSCQKGHELTPENTYVYDGGRRRCRTCTLARNHGYDRAKRRAA